ncbi:MAG: hypothetical protein M3137_15870 [Actinomycetota bacterium]|nr:hypothetical protein [Actinomycetota bacterium]
MATAASVSVPTTHSPTPATTAPAPSVPATTPRTTPSAPSGGGTYRPRSTYTTRQSPPTYNSQTTASTAPATTAPATTTTSTVAPLPGGIPVSPSTLPLTTKNQNGHVNPVFAELSGVGFFIALALIAVQAVLTRRGGKHRSL